MTLSALVRVLIDSYLPDMHQKYVMNNLKSSEWYRQYNSFVPVFLHGRPRSVITHCLERQARGKKYDSTDIVMSSSQNGVFTILKPSGGSHTVDFGGEGEPSCTCKDWKRWKIPCKHFFGVFNTNKEWGWNSLSSSYLQSAYLSCDTDTASGLYQKFGEWQSSSEQEAIELGDSSSTPQIIDQCANESDQLLQLQQLTDFPDSAIDVTEEPPKKKVRINSHHMIYYIVHTLFTEETITVCRGDKSTSKFEKD